MTKEAHLRHLPWKSDVYEFPSIERRLCFIPGVQKVLNRNAPDGLQLSEAMPYIIRLFDPYQFSTHPLL